MKAWFDLMVFPILILILGTFHWISDSLIFEISMEKIILENSNLAEDLANSFLIGNCTSTTHILETLPQPFGTYRIFRISIVDDFPKLIVIGNENG